MTTDDKLKILNVHHNTGEEAIKVQCLLKIDDTPTEKILDSFYLRLGKKSNKKVTLHSKTDTSTDISSENQFYVFPSNMTFNKINETSIIVNLEFLVPYRIKGMNKVDLCNQLFCHDGKNILAELSSFGQNFFKFRDERLEPSLFFFRYLLLGATIASILGSFYLILNGCTEMINIFLSHGEHHDLRLSIIQSIDSFLFATVLMIFGLGIYNLFISPIEIKQSDTDTHWLKIKSLDDLKSYLTKTIIMILTITFFENVIEADMIKSSIDMVYFTGSIALIALTTFLLHVHVNIGNKESTK